MSSVHTIKEESTEELAARLLRQVLESPSKEGVYFVVRFPSTWRLYSFTWENFGRLSHLAAWTKFVAPELANAWLSALNKPEELCMPTWHRGTEVFREDAWKEPRRINTLSFELTTSPEPELPKRT